MPQFPRLPLKGFCIVSNFFSAVASVPLATIILKPLCLCFPALLSLLACSLQKMCHLPFFFPLPPLFFFFFLHDRSGPAGEVPPLPSCFVQRMKSEESDERSICWGGWGRRQSKERWWAEGGKGLLLLFFFRLLTTLAPNDVCVYVWERQTAWIFPCSHHSTGIFTAGGPALPPSGGLDGQITFTIYKIQKLCLDKTS